jgi:poly(beta-D-mannuronate) lyase
MAPSQRTFRPPSLLGNCPRRCAGSNLCNLCLRGLRLFRNGLSSVGVSHYSVRTMTGRWKLGGTISETLLIVLFAGVCQGWAQNVENPHASVADVARCQARFLSTTDPLLLEARTGLRSCAAMPFAPPPVGRMIIPRRYLLGSSGPINPNEGPATRPYRAFEERITAGAAQFLATGSHRESASALDQIDAWAKAGALLDYSRDESQQAWFQVEWTLCSAAITDSVLVNDSNLDPAKQQEITSWLVAVCRKDLSFERVGDAGNNHLYWRALAAMAVGVTASETDLYRHAISVYKKAINEVDANGAFPKEMARHEYAIHYQGFALQPLVTIAQFASRQGLDLYSYKNAQGRTLRDAIVFFGRAVDDPALVRPYTADPQSAHFSPEDFASFAFWRARFGTEGLPPSIANALLHPVATSRIGYTTIMAAQ